MVVFGGHMCIRGLAPSAPVAETGFSHRLTAYKIVGHFFGLSYLKISGNNQVENIFFRISNISVPCLHTQLRGRTVIKKSWTFFGPWGRDRSQSPPCWIFRVKQIHQFTASERTTRLWRRGITRSNQGEGLPGEPSQFHLWPGKGQGS